MLVITILLLVVGIIFLIKGSGIFVGSASHIARKLGVSDFIIGLTLVALGTSLPELISSIVASIDGESGLIFGTILGANIANLTLIIGTAAILSKIKIEKQVLKRDGYILFFVISLLFLFIFDGVISRIEGIVFVLLYLSYTFFLIESKINLNKDYDFSDFAKYFVRFGYLSYLKKGIFLKFHRKKKVQKRGKLLKHYLFLLLGLGIVYLSAELVVDKAVYLAEYFLLAPIVIGVLISIGTTLPEFSVALSASSKKYGNVAIGNAIGSTITNTLLVLGVASIIHPLEVARESILAIFPFLFSAMIIVLLFIKTNFEISKKEGAVLILVYLLFLARMVFY